MFNSIQAAIAEGLRPSFESFLESAEFANFIATKYFVHRDGTFMSEAEIAGLGGDDGGVAGETKSSRK